MPPESAKEKMPFDSLLFAPKAEINQIVLNNLLYYFHHYFKLKGKLRYNEDSCKKQFNESFN